MYIVTLGMNPNEDYICHYGVKGMRWGQHLFGRAMLGPTTYHAVSKELESQAKKRGYNSYDEWAKAEKEQRAKHKVLMKTVKSGKKMSTLDKLGGRKDFIDHDKNIVKKQKEVAEKFSKMSSKEAKSYIENQLKADTKAINDIPKTGNKRKDMEARDAARDEIKDLQKLKKSIASGKLTEPVDIGKKYIEILDDKKIYEGLTLKEALGIGNDWNDIYRNAKY